MDLPTFILEVGDAKAGKLFGVSERTAQSWRRLERIPSKKFADVIVRKAPVSYEEIYSAKRRDMA